MGRSRRCGGAPSRFATPFDFDRPPATLPPAAFWVPAVGSSLLNALTKTLETKAFSESDVSLCAPFLAFDPVMQFVVGAVVMPST